ncbi:MAG: amidohydrolase, partial [Desulfobacteraceae bacterium]|nr:amidohydrolase [Desulfobacteraceae bacterium]
MSLLEAMENSLRDLTDFRRQLHRDPELSGAEGATAAMVLERVSACRPAHILRKLGGHGTAFVFDGEGPGPTVMLRCELDAVPVQEHSRAPHSSRKEGVAHACGHDGHMAIMVGIAELLAAKRPARGKVVLLFQPAEETAEGAAAVAAEPRFGRLHLDWVFALHNHPGFPEGSILIRNGVFYCASRGLTARLVGTTSHASEPEKGKNPALALARLIQRLDRLPAEAALPGRIVLATIVHARLGFPGFGVSAGDAEIMATLRADTEEGMDALAEAAAAAVGDEAAKDALEWETLWSDLFPATRNDPDACRLLERAAAAAALPVIRLKEPFRASEDFGVFTASTRGAAFGFGSGVGQPALHT